VSTIAFGAFAAGVSSLYANFAGTSWLAAGAGEGALADEVAGGIADAIEVSIGGGGGGCGVVVGVALHAATTSDRTRARLGVRIAK
jgi:hypothetical protein